MKKTIFFLALIVLVLSSWSNSIVDNNFNLCDTDGLDNLPPLVTPSNGGDLDSIPPLVKPAEEDENGDGLDDLIPLKK